MHVSYWTYDKDAFCIGCSSHDSALPDKKFSTREALFAWLKANMIPEISFPRLPLSFTLYGFGEIGENGYGKKENSANLQYGETTIIEEESYLCYSRPVLIEVSRQWEEVIQQEVKEEGRYYVAKKVEKRKEILLPCTPLIVVRGWQGKIDKYMIDKKFANSYEKGVLLEVKAHVYLKHVEFDIED